MSAFGESGLSDSFLSSSKLLGPSLDPGGLRKTSNSIAGKPYLCTDTVFYRKKDKDWRN